MFNNGYGGYGTYPYPLKTDNFGMQYGNAQQQQPQSQSSGNFYYINGVEGAKAFLVPPNSTVILFDSDSNKFFIKTTNQNGQATLKQFDYTESIIENGAKKEPQINLDDYVSKSEFNELKSQIKPFLMVSKEVNKNE